MSTVECIACGHVGATKSKGSTFVTVMLLIFLFPVGILYWLLNRSGGKVCSACGSSHVKLYIPKPRQIQQPTISQDKPVYTAGKTKLVSNDVFPHNASKQVQFDENNIEQKNCPDCRELIRVDARKCKHCGSMVNE